MNEDFKTIAADTLTRLVNSDNLDFHARYKLYKAIEIIIFEWAELRELTAELSAPEEGDE